MNLNKIELHRVVGDLTAFANGFDKNYVMVPTEFWFHIGAIQALMHYVASHVRHDDSNIQGLFCAFKNSAYFELEYEEDLQAFLISNSR